jgi:hypothetical protein
MAAVKIHVVLPSVRIRIDATPSKRNVACQRYSVKYFLLLLISALLRKIWLGFWHRNFAQAAVQTQFGQKSSPGAF